MRQPQEVQPRIWARSCGGEAVARPPRSSGTRPLETRSSAARFSSAQVPAPDRLSPRGPTAPAPSPEWLRAPRSRPSLAAAGCRSLGIVETRRPGRKASARASAHRCSSRASGRDRRLRRGQPLRPRRACPTTSSSRTRDRCRSPRRPEHRRGTDRSRRLESERSASEEVEARTRRGASTLACLARSSLPRGQPPARPRSRRPSRAPPSSVRSREGQLRNPSSRGRPQARLPLPERAQRFPRARLPSRVSPRRRARLRSPPWRCSPGRPY